VFLAEIASGFNMPAGDIAVVVAECPDHTTRLAWVAEMASGTHAGAAVIAAPVPVRPVVEDADGLLTSLGSIFVGTAAEKRARMVNVVEKYPAFGTALTLLRGVLTPNTRAFILEVTTRIKARVGTSVAVLTQTEYDNLRTLATAKGLAGLVA
jgi:hypothetical protein